MFLIFACPREPGVTACNGRSISLPAEYRLTPKLQNLILPIEMKFLKLLSVILAGLWLVACAHTSSTQATKPQQEKTQQSQTESSQPQEAAEKSPSGQTSAQEAAKDKQKQASEKSPSSQEASQQTARDKQKQASDETQSGQADPPDAAKDEQKQAAEKSPSGQTDSQQAAKDAQKQAADKTESGQPAAGTEKTPGTETARQSSTSDQQAPAGAAGTQSKAAEKGASSSRPDAAGTADSKLAEARKNLRISEATEQRIAAELEQLKKSGTASPETIKNYETYHERVQEMVAENRKIVEQMEAAKARHSSGAASSEAAGGGEAGDLHDPRIPEEQTTGEVAALDRQLNASLNQFDARLLKEMDEIRDGSAEKMHDLAQEAAEAAKRLREKGVDVETSGAESSEGSEEAAAQDREQTQTEQEAKGSKSASTDSSRPGGKGAGGAEQGRASTEDDDIVARQLREAAENETDPELKEKLWKEYDEYKNNQR